MNGASIFGILGGLSGFVAVACGAFGAHVLRGRLEPDMLQVFDTGARYQLVHAVALVGVALALERRAHSALTLAGWLLTAGQALFPGSLYALALTGVGTWGAVTPLGGLCYLGGWVTLALGFLNRKPAAP